MNPPNLATVYIEHNLFLYFAEINRLQGKVPSSSPLPPSSSAHLTSASSSSFAAGGGVGGLGGSYRDPIKYVDVYRERPIRLTVRVLVPVREHPKVR